MSLFTRFCNHLRARTHFWLRRRERRNPEAVYEEAIRERQKQYAKLREAAAGILYLRGKLTREAQSRASELVGVRRQLDIAVDGGEDEIALTLIRRRDVLVAEAERLAGELADLTQEAETAKKNLILFGDDIARLQDEKVRNLARLANAKARLRLQETLGGLSPDGDAQALDTVREYVQRLGSEVQISQELEDGELGRKLADIREAESLSSARAQLEELKRSRRKLLPLMLRDVQPVATVA